MFEGLWIVQVRGPNGEGSGVAVMTNGQLYGGDSSFVWTGSYEKTDDKVQARVSVKRFRSDAQSVSGTPGDIDLLVEGTLDDNVVNGTASLEGTPDAKMAVRLTRYSTL